MRLPGRLVRGPIRPDRWTALRFASLRWAALPVIDRRWTAPMAAIALGFGLFVGVAIGPGTQGSLGTTRPMVVQVPATDQGTTTTADASPSGGKPDLPPASSLGQKPDNSQVSPFNPPATSTPPPYTPPPVASTPPITSTPYTPPITDTTTTTDTTTDQTTTTPSETTTDLAGTVVHLNPKAGSYTISSDDQLIAIHSGNLPDLGQNIEVEGLQLANGTYGEDGSRTRDGKRGSVSFGGKISFRDPATGVYTVSAPGVSMLVRGGAQRTPPKLGDTVQLEGRFVDHATELTPAPAGREGCGKPPALPKPPKTSLEQVGTVHAGAAADESTDEGADTATETTTDVEAIVEGVCRNGARTLIVSADDLREGGRDIPVGVPSDFNLGSVEPGDVVKLSTQIGKAGNYTLAGLASDDRRQGADDDNLIQP
jgi:hypothetical protein